MSRSRNEAIQQTLNRIKSVCAETDWEWEAWSERKPYSLHWDSRWNSLSYAHRERLYVYTQYFGFQARKRVGVLIELDASVDQIRLKLRTLRNKIDLKLREWQAHDQALKVRDQKEAERKARLSEDWKKAIRRALEQPEDQPATHKFLGIGSNQKVLTLRDATELRIELPRDLDQRANLVVALDQLLQKYVHTDR